MAYVDGYLIPVPRDKRDAYRAMAAQVAEVFKGCGALSVTECWGDDLPRGKVTDFHMAVKSEDNEAVVFSWILWPDKATRDAGMAKAMQDPLMQPGASPPVFDGKRMIFGGFEVILQA
ncbi:MAG: DUF1428 domain-containing protein [Hyphomonadaceae bacterium]